MYLHVDEFLGDWNTESALTAKLFEVMTDDSLTQPVVPGGRTAGFIAWHIAMSISNMLRRMGLMEDGPDPESPAPGSAEEIRVTYRLMSDALVEAIRSQWTDETLSEERDLFGATWTNSFTLAVIIRHQIHHRAQLTVLLRQAGVVIPGIYGPAKEEWAAMGREAQR